MGSIFQLKQTIVEQLLKKENFFLIVVDPTDEKVQLPKHLKEKKQPVGVHIGLHMAISIPDLKIDEYGVQGTLSFDRTPFYCIFPWTSLLQISVGEEHLIWLCPQTNDKINSTKESSQKRRPPLRLVE